MRTSTIERLEKVNYVIYLLERWRTDVVRRDFETMDTDEIIEEAADIMRKLAEIDENMSQLRVLKE